MVREGRTVRQANGGMEGRMDESAEKVIYRGRGST